VRFLSISLICFFVTFSSLVFGEQQETLIFGVHPFKNPRQIYKMFRPLTNAISQQTGKEVKIVIGKSYEDIIDQHQQGKVDFGYFGPASYVNARAKTNIIPLTRIKMKGRGAFRGVIVVKKDSPITGLHQLKGKTFAFGDPESTLSHYVPHYQLMKAGVMVSDLKDYIFTGTHDNVALNVIHGVADAGGLKPAVAKQYLNRGLRILDKSEWIPEHLFAANGALASENIHLLKNVLLEMDLIVLKSIKSSITGMETASDRDYDGLRKIIIEVNSNDPIATSIKQ